MLHFFALRHPILVTTLIGLCLMNIVVKLQDKCFVASTCQAIYRELIIKFYCNLEQDSES